MQKKWGLLLLVFAALFFLLHIASVMPDLIHGYRSLFRQKIGMSGTQGLIADILLSSLFSIIPYLILSYYFPKFGFWSLPICLASLPILFLFCYGMENYLAAVRLKNYFSEHLFYDLIFAALGILYYFFQYSHYQELQQKEAIIQSRQAELSFLRSQINPHFLFNSLNNIYSLVYEQSPQSLHALATLSELLRYILYDTKEKVQLQEELNYIQKYISLQRLRFGYEISVTVNIIGNIQEIFLPPLLLIPFVENAFKHGELLAQAEGIAINIIAMHQKLFFHCTNKKGSHQRDKAGGIGLQNVRRRLELLYPGKHKLQLKEDDNSFTAQLEITYV
jgi:two-component system, LytTR family, sensor kinase